MSRTTIVLPASAWFAELRAELTEAGLSDEAATIAAKTVLNRLIARHDDEARTAAVGAADGDQIVTSTV